MKALPFMLRTPLRALLSDRFFLGGMVVFAVIGIGLQVYGGAYQAEFTGHADEPAHFVSSLLVRDYLGQLPPDPMPWAVQYYMHYPKVAIGHWPPGYYLAQAVWWLVFPVGRASALWLNIGMLLVTMVFFYVLARRIRAGWALIVTGALLLCTRIVQEACAMVMADLPSLVAGMAVLWTLTRLLEEPGLWRFLAVVMALGGTLLMKGTGVALLLALVVVLTVDGLWKKLPLGKTVSILAGGGIAVTSLYLWQYRGSFDTIRAWSGLNPSIPWRIDFLPLIVGNGCLVLAAVGLVIAFRRRQPAALAAGAVMISMAVVSYYVRAMQEERHWIVAVPALLLLSLTGYAWLEERWPRLAPVAALGAILLFPFTFYRQETEGFRDLAAQLKLPARMLVSSTTGWREGPWIAIVAEGEARTGSTIVRATKLLAKTDWMGYRYQSLIHDGEETSRLLDEKGIDIVVLDNFTKGAPGGPAHHFLLREFVRTDTAWRPCAKAQDLEAYCRTLPPRFPRKPLQIDLRSRLGYMVEER
jgi:hypothetical protein